MSINDDTTALIQQISLYAALCQKALKGHGDVYEAMRKQTYGDIRKEIKALYQYKEDAEKWRTRIAANKEYMEELGLTDKDMDELGQINKASFIQEILGVCRKWELFLVGCEFNHFEIHRLKNKTQLIDLEDATDCTEDV